MRSFCLVPICLLLVVCSPLWIRAAAPSTWGGLEQGSFGVGFRLFEESDGSRAIRPDSTGDEVWPRPVRAYLWYPAASSEREPMSFGDYADLATQDVWPEQILAGARERIGMGVRPLARSLGPEGWARLRAQPVVAVRAAEPAAGRFPLIAVGQGLYYESPIAHAMLCEVLASHGFVVVTTPLVGTNSPLVNLDTVDLETQVRDLELAIAIARDLPFVSQSELGLVGFDMGGMACLILAMRNPDVDAFASMDAGILFGHPAGIPVDAHHYDPGMLRVPWFHATQRRAGTAPEGHQGTALFDQAIHADRSLLLVDGVGHVDFTSYALITDRAPVITYWGPVRGGEKQRYEAVVRSLLRFFAGHLQGRLASLSELHGDPEEVEPGLGVHLEHRPAVPLMPVYGDLLNALLKGDGDRVVELSRRIRAASPQSPLLSEGVVNRLGYHLIGSWEMFDQAIAVFQINTEIHPESANAWDSLGEGLMLHGDTERAAVCFRKVLELDPGNQRALELLTRLAEGDKE